jgi:hypothetical protein
VTPIGDNLSAFFPLPLTIILRAENGDRLPSRVPRREFRTSHGNPQRTQ